MGTPTTEAFAKDAFRSWTIAAHADGGESEVFVIFTVYIMQTSVCMLILCGLQRIDHLLHSSLASECTGQKYSDFFFTLLNYNPVDLLVP